MSTRLFISIMFVLGLLASALGFSYMLPPRTQRPFYPCDREVSEDASWPVILDESPADDRCECGPNG